jgi:hypothetical protein
MVYRLISFASIFGVLNKYLPKKANFSTANIFFLPKCKVGAENWT